MSFTSDKVIPVRRRPRPQQRWGWWWLVCSLALLGAVNGVQGIHRHWDGRSPIDATYAQRPIPLIMQGGDPHIRALMRTISASESNSTKPYTILYGGEQIQDLSQHPDRCITIVAGPNTGNCSTAAGRYQFITTTWLEKAQRYHPQPSRFLFWGDYSFEARYQDEVVYRWLSDPNAWGVDLAQLLRNGEVNEVLRLLSPTWTSLGYGIETNSMSGFLPEIYYEMLDEELQVSPSS